MLKLNELKQGDIIAINDEGIIREGTVVRTSPEERKALVNNGVQEFWYSQEEMGVIWLDDKQLARLGFVKETVEDGIKYKKDSFRLKIPKENDFSHVEMWWREDIRQFHNPIAVHDLQNLYLTMTKVPLELS